MFCLRYSITNVGLRQKRDQLSILRTILNLYTLLLSALAVHYTNLILTDV
jgi:hypothetical protein